MLGWLRLAVLVIVGQEHWYVWHGIHLLTGLLTVDDCWLYLFYMCAVWSFLPSMCVCIQICIFISRGCHFIETSLNNFLPATIHFFNFFWFLKTLINNQFHLLALHLLSMIYLLYFLFFYNTTWCLEDGNLTHF